MRAARTALLPLLAAVLVTTSGPVARACLASDCVARSGTYRALVIGDSIAWGQGLEDADKAYRKIATEFARRDRRDSVVEIVRAHSGAWIDWGHDTDDTHATSWGEIPAWAPTVREQAEWSDAPLPDTLDERSAIDLVIVSGCINDSGVLSLFADAETTLDDVDALAEAHCGPDTDPGDDGADGDMGKLLGFLVGHYPRAEIVVMGYYSIVSESTDAPFGVPMPLLATADFVFAFFEGWEDPEESGMLQRSQRWGEASSVQLGAAVDQANASLAAAGEGARVFLAVPEFGPRNAFYAAEAWLWPYPAADPHVDDRTEDCDTRDFDDDGTAEGSGEDDWSTFSFPWTRCAHASAFHPNVEGALGYRDAMLSRGRGTVRWVIPGLAASNPQSLLGALGAASPVEESVIELAAGCFDLAVHDGTPDEVPEEGLVITKPVHLESHGGCALIGRDL